jgi:hypothetical protein
LNKRDKKREEDEEECLLWANVENCNLKRRRSEEEEKTSKGEVCL